MTAETGRLGGGSGRDAVLGTMGAVMLGVVGVLSWSGGPARTDDVFAASSTGVVELASETRSVQFAAHAVGTVARQTPLMAQAGGGEALAHLAAGTAVRIGGRVRSPAALGTRDLLWVGTGDDAGARFGFVLSDDVVVGAGDAPTLALAGVPAAALLNPGMAVHSGGSGSAAPAEASSANAPKASSAGVADTAGAGQLRLPWLPDTVARWNDLFVAVGARHGVDPELLAIIALVESGGNPKAVSPAGATGLMQVMPATAAGIARERGMADHATARLTDPAYNADFGAYYIAQQLRSFGRASDPDWQQSVELAAAAYNGGPGSVLRQQSGGALPGETQRYQRWVGGMWRERHGASQATLQQWLAAGGQVLVDRARQAPVDD